jgi:glucose-6-phosphate dehydrogenase assembly protein OpcA
VLRACALTLIVIEGDGERAEPAGETLAELMRDHPSRAIVVRVRPGEKTPEARVFAQCRLPFGRRKQICSEQIEITVGEARLGDVAPVLLALAAPDLPVVVWRRSGLVGRMAGLERVEALAGKVILDSEDCAEPCAVLSQVMDPRRVSDLAWTRLTAFREAVAQALEGARPDDIAEVRITHAGVPVRAWYLAGWMATALGWAPEDPRLSVAADGFDDVQLAGSGLSITLRRTAERTRREAELLGEELAIAGRDPVYERSLAAAIEIGRRGR